jgi:hypothetical protein
MRLGNKSIVLLNYDRIGYPEAIHSIDLSIHENIIIGRGVNSHIRYHLIYWFRIKDISVSRTHAKIYAYQNNIIIED